ncbi:MAG: efflux RND transporter periplasmic adaptor subunit [Desulfobacterales bacterium]|nr:efflux RND transporter periplasmic adaptor subunit [Desulfobacterales bacterium]
MLKKRILQIVVSLLILLSGVAGLYTLKAGKPTPEQEVAAAPAPVVQVVTAEVGRHTVRITGQGTVRPLLNAQLVAQVSGRVVYTAPSLVNGGAFRAGDELLKIDPIDYELAVTLAAAKIGDAESKYALALEESEAAIQEWRDLNPGVDPPDLVARKPQLSAARAKLEAEEADYRIALLQLERTGLKAPFDGVVSAKAVDIGQYVTPGQAVATLYGTEAVEIVVPLESDHLQWFHVPGFTGGDGVGSRAVVQVAIAGQVREWGGRVMRAEGRIDEKTRLINVVVRVDNPYARKPPLAAGLFAQVEIEGNTLDVATFLPRAALRPGNTVWVVGDDQRLGFRTVDVARIAKDGVLIRGGLASGDRVIISQVRAVTDGMKVRTLNGAEEGRP